MMAGVSHPEVLQSSALSPASTTSKTSSYCSSKRRRKPYELVCSPPALPARVENACARPPYCGDGDRSACPHHAPHAVRAEILAGTARADAVGSGVSIRDHRRIGGSNSQTDHSDPARTEPGTTRGRRAIHAIPVFRNNHGKSPGGAGTG